MVRAKRDQHGDFKIKVEGRLSGEMRERFWWRFNGDG